MIDPSLNPSRQLRILAHAARWLLGLVLTFWLLLAVAWGTLHGFIVPRISDWRVEVEGLASRALGAPVQIAAIAAQSDSWFPTVHLSGVSVLDAQGRQALKLQTVIATVSARSLLRLGLEQLYIDAPELDIRHLPDGRWQVAGLDVVQSDTTESPVLEWLLEQPELVIQKGRVFFTDEQRALSALQWNDVDVVIRNRRWSHVVRVDATPAAGEGERMQLIGAFRQPLLPSSGAVWAGWSGQWYAALQLQQVPALPWPSTWGVKALEGHGQARVWVDVQRGRPMGMTADVALSQARVAWQDAQVADLALQQVKGRFEGRWQPQGWRLQGRDFSFQQVGGGFWPSSNWAVSAAGPVGAATSTSVELDYADLALTSQVVRALPLPPAWHQALQQWAPQGELRQLQLVWHASGSYEASGQVAQLALQPQPAEQGAGMPGVQGLNATFELNTQGGTAGLSMQGGSLHFPGVFEESEIPMHSLQAQVRWSIHDGRVKVEVPQARFANDDAQGSLQGFWQTGAQGEERLPGYLQLRGQLEQANGARVYRYLPLSVPDTARHYVRDSVRQGQGRDVEFEVRGNLHDMPFDRPGTGRFWIKAPVHDVVYAFVPEALHGDASPLWPALTGLDGTLVFEGASMHVQQASTGFAGHPKLRMASVSAHIPDLSHPHVTVNAAGQTDLQAALGLVRQSPLAALTSHALDSAKAQGSAQIAFDLELPIAQLDKTRVRGRVGFRSNALQFNPEAPQLQQLQGAVQFHDQGFELVNVHGQTLGGNFKMEGGMASARQGVRLLARGVATSAGLQKDGNVPLLAQIAAHAVGQSAYTVEVTASQGAQKVQVRSDLRGMALSLPPPLDKPVDEAVALNVVQSLNAQHLQELRVEVAGRGWASYVQDAAQTPAKMLRGRLVLGAAPPAELQGEGVSAHIGMPQLDADAWLRVIRATGAGSNAHAVPSLGGMWLPQRITLDVGQLRLQERELERVKADLAHTDGAWRGRLNAQHFAGTVEYRPAVEADASGRLFARLTHLTIPRSEAQRLNQAPAEPAATEVESLPALDIEVEQLEIAGKSLGKLRLKARNRVGQYGRDWLLEQFDLTTPEARWRAQGQWIASARGVPRSTQLNFSLEMDSAGKLLERFGMPEVIRDGKGRLHGHIAWQGAPITPQWKSMDGAVHMQVERGQFLKAEPGMGKLLSVLSLQSLTRRMVLDFRDVFSQGFAFDFVRGDINVDKGVARTNNLQMKGLNAAVLMEGRASLEDETQDLTVVVVPEINAMTASLAATAINPVIGVGSFVAQMFLRGPLMEAATRTFHIQGTWADPVVAQVRNKSPAAPASQAGSPP